VATDTAAGSEGTAVPEAPAPEEEVPLPMVAKKEEELSGEGASGEGAVTTAAEEDLDDEEGGMELEAIAALPDKRELIGEEDGAVESEETEGVEERAGTETEALPDAAVVDAEASAVTGKGSTSASAPSTVGPREEAASAGATGDVDDLDPVEAASLERMEREEELPSDSLEASESRRPLGRHRHG